MDTTLWAINRHLCRALGITENLHTVSRVELTLTADKYPTLIITRGIIQEDPSKAVTEVVERFSLEPKRGA